MQETDKVQKFSFICEDLKGIYKVKNADYSDSFSRLFEEYGMTYSIIHLEEKLNRIKSLQKKSNEVDGETFIDSLKDLVNYGILTLIELQTK